MQRDLREWRWMPGLPHFLAFVRGTAGLALLAVAGCGGEPRGTRASGPARYSDPATSIGVGYIQGALERPEQRPGGRYWPSETPPGFQLRRVQQLRLPVGVPDKGADHFHTPIVTSLTTRRAVVEYMPSGEAERAGVAPDPEAHWVVVTTYPAGTSCRFRGRSSGDPRPSSAPPNAGVLRVGPVSVRAYLDGRPYDQPIPVVDIRSRSLSSFTCAVTPQQR